MRKILFYDVETTGLDSKIHGIHQISGYFDIDGQIMTEFNFNIKPAEHLVIDDEALKIAGVSRSMLETYPSEGEIYRQFVKLLSYHINKYDKQDKAFLAGYNVHFDNGFLRAFFERNKDQYFGSWFWSNPIDVMVIATDFLIDRRSSMFNFKLLTVAQEIFGIVDESKLHNAMYDVELTRNIYYHCKM